MGIRAMAVHAKGGMLEEIRIEPPPLGEGDVEIRVEHCGVCYSDPALIDDEFGMSHYPLVPGHEVIGIVEATGSGVTGLRSGQRVGVGWQSSSCGHCRQCRSGEEKFCGEAEYTAVRGFGGFAEVLRCNARFAIPLPSEIEPALAGPLMCAGSTVFSPLVTFDVRPGQKVGVLGIGGLGHLALQFARAMGTEVTAFTTTRDKEAEALQLGAHHVVATRDNPGLFQTQARQFDFILSTVFADLDWGAWMGLLAPRGRFCHVGIPGRPLAIPVLSVLVGDRAVVGSNIANPLVMEDMLSFARLHGIRPITEHFPFSEANAAISHMRAGKARFRAVLDIGA